MEIHVDLKDAYEEAGMIEGVDYAPDNGFPTPSGREKLKAYYNIAKRKARYKHEIAMILAGRYKDIVAADYEEVERQIHSSLTEDEIKNPMFQQLKQKFERSLHIKNIKRIEFRLIMT